MLWFLIIGIVIAVILVFVYGYNRIVTLEKNVEQAWADIDVQLERVSELFPNLMNAIKGSARFEKSVLENIAKAHTELIKAMSSKDVEKKVKAANKFLGFFVPIVYQIPQYPDLKTTTSFKELLDKINVAIDKIAYARQFYNQAVKDYNTFVASIPWVLFRKQQKPYFELPKLERQEITEGLKKGEFTKGLEKV